MPRSAGGLNLISLLNWNKAAICKLLWAMTQKKDVLWVKWVHSYYVKCGDLVDIPIPTQASWVIRKIFGVR